MITIEQDVSVKYIESTGLNYKNSKSNLIFLEDLSQIKPIEDQYGIGFVKEISSIDVLKGIVPEENQTAIEFAKTFFAQNVRPRSYFLCACKAAASSGILFSGVLPSFEDFKKKYTDKNDDGINLMPFAFKISIAGEEIEYNLNNLIIRSIKNYEMLWKRLNEQNPKKAILTISKNQNYEDFVTIVTKEKGSTEGKITFATEKEETVSTPSVLLTGEILYNSESTYDQFVTRVKQKESLESDKKFNDFTLGSKTYTLTTELLEQYGSFEKLAEALNAQHSDSITVEAIEDRLVFKSAGSGELSYMTGEFAQHLCGDEDRKAILIPAKEKTYMCTGHNDLKISADSGAHIILGTDEKTGTSDFMEYFAKALSTYGIRPNAIVCSRNLTKSGAAISGGKIDTDLDKTKNIITGFNTHFSTSDGTPTTSTLFIGTNKYAITGQSGVTSNAFEEFKGKPNSRNLCINYVGKDLSAYLDGAIATYCCGINWNSSNIVRNTKGLTFNNIKADKFIGNDMDSILNSFLINCYAMMDNGMEMYRNGLTMSTGDMGYIDSAVALNALIIDMKDELMILLSNGRLKMNADGANMLYATLSDVCSKYKRNGFLSDTTMKKTIKGESVDITIPAFSIKVPRQFTSEELNTRNFPECRVIIASTRFANTITISVKDIVNNQEDK